MEFFFLKSHADCKMKAIKCRRKNSEGESKKGLSKTCRDIDMTLGSHFGKKKNLNLKKKKKKTK